jgi:hypothetical protein
MTAIMSDRANLPPEACKESHEHGEEGSCRECRWCGMVISGNWPIYTHEQNCPKRPK